MESVLSSDADNGYTLNDWPEINANATQGLEPQGKEHVILSSRSLEIKDVTSRTPTMKNMTPNVFVNIPAKARTLSSFFKTF